MNNTVVVGLVALVIGAGGGYIVSQNQQPPSVEHMGSTMENMTANLENRMGEDFEKAFIDEMIVHHEGAVAMAHMVLQKTERPELVQLANDIISAQTREIEMMRAWKMQWFEASVHGMH